MTKQELLEMARKLQEQADGMEDEPSDTSESTDSEDPPSASESEADTSENPDTDIPPESEDIDPQPNGEIQPDVTEVQPAVKSEFVDTPPVPAVEPVGVEEPLTSNIDERFATAFQQYQEVKQELDKLKVAINEIMTRVDLVQEVTDKVATVDHDTLLTESIKLLV